MDIWWNITAIIGSYILNPCPIFFLALDLIHFLKFYRQVDQITAFQPKDWEEIGHESDGPYKPPSYLCSSTFFPLCLAGRGCHLLRRAELLLLASLSKWRVGPFSSPTIRNTHFNLWVSTTKPYAEWVQRHFILLILSPPFTVAKTNK